MHRCRTRVETALDRWLPDPSIQPVRLHAAMRYAALGGGKRLRPTLAYAAGEALGISSEELDGPACAVELIHAYSLVHDDLPAMDDDDLRRGRSTCHRAFDEATAILVGDALQTLAFLVLAKDPAMRVSAETRMGMIENLAMASGSRGMAGGQALDLGASSSHVDLATLENIHIHKTGALIRASVRMATLYSGPTTAELADRLDHYAACVGLAFQIRDDILDVEGNTAQLGKTQGKDATQGKATYPALLGLAESRERAESLCHDALQSLSGFGAGADPLRWIARYIVGREH